MTWTHARTHAVLAAALLVAAATTARAQASAQAPANFRLWAAQTTSGITLSWDSVPGATEYRIYLGDPSHLAAGVRPLAVFSGSGRRGEFRRIGDLSRGLYLVAVAKGKVLLEARFNRVFTSETSLPITAPSAVLAQETGPTEITLSWAPVPGATAYLIGRAAYPSGLQVLCDLCSVTPKYVDRGATPGVQHSYTVQAIFSTGISRRVSSNPVTPGTGQLAAGGPGQDPPADSTPPHPPADTSHPPASPGTDTAVASAPPAPPSNVQATLASTPGTVVVSWDPSPSAGVDGYTLFRLSFGHAHQVQHVTATVRNFEDHFSEDQLAGISTLLSYYLVATSAAGPSARSAPSNEVTVTPPPPQPPTGVRADVEAPASVRLRWDASPSPGIEKYVVYRYLNGRLSSNLSYGGAVRDVQDMLGQAEFANGPVHVSYIVAAQRSGGLSAFSPRTPELLVAEPPVEPPSQANATVLGTSSVRVSWQPSRSPRVTAYVVKRIINQGGAVPVAQLAPGVLSYVDSAFTAAQFVGGPLHVSYVVMAIRGGVETAQSPPTGEVVLAPPPAPSTPPVAPPAPSPDPNAPACKLEYQRADNMWAAFGRPDGPLGTESIALKFGERKVFSTDWAYEKKRNDGSNFYGSHLRVAKNVSVNHMVLTLRNPSSAAIDRGSGRFEKTATGKIIGVRLYGGGSARFRDDLMEVHCSG